MAYLLLMEKVKDYSKWKPVIDELAKNRKEYGSQGGRIFHLADKPNELGILYEFESIEKAKKYAQSADVKKKIERAGIIGKSEFYYLEEVEQVPV